MGCAARPDGRSNPLDRNGEHISYTALGLDDARRARVAFELRRRRRICTSMRSKTSSCTRALQQVLPAERAPRRIEKGDQQGVLAFGQCYRSAGRVGKPPSLAVELPAAKSKRPCSGSRAGAARPISNRRDTDTREQFAQIERLGQIIVGAELEPDDAIDVVAAVTSDDDDWHVGVRPDSRSRSRPSS